MVTREDRNGKKTSIVGENRDRWSNVEELIKKKWKREIPRSLSSGNSWSSDGSL